MSNSHSTRVIGLNPSKVPKAQWFDDNTKIFLEILVEEIHAGNHVNNQFTGQGWKNICEKFESRSGLPYSKNQLKNRLSQLRIMYSKWKKLIERATGVGFDPVTNTIAADDSWWAAQAQEDPEVLKWKCSPPKFVDLMSQCYARTYASGKHAYIPQYVSQHTDFGSGSTSVGETEPNKAHHLPDSVPNVLPADVNAQSANVSPCTYSCAPSTKRRRESEARKSSENFEVALTAPDPILKEIDSAYELLNKQPYIEWGSEFHALAMTVLRDKLNRHIFVHWVSDFAADVQVKWFRASLRVTSRAM